MINKSPYIFITGASGFIGGAICKALIEHGYRVKAMARSQTASNKINKLGAEPVDCDLKTVSASHLSECSIVIHTAAFIGPWGLREQYWQDNVEGTNTLLMASKEANIKRFIHMSSESAVFHAKAMDNIDETEPYALDSPFIYCKTKAISEKLVLEQNNSAKGFETIALRPRLVWGPGDQSVLPTIIDAIHRGLFFWIDKGKHMTCTTHINNLVQATLSALDNGRGGEAYFITDGNQVSFKDFISKQLQQHAVKIPSKSIPAWLIKSLSSFCNFIWNTFNIKTAPPFPHFGVYLLSYDSKINIDKAIKELKYSPKDELTKLENDANS